MVSSYPSRASEPVNLNLFLWVVLTNFGENLISKVNVSPSSIVIGSWSVKSLISYSPVFDRSFAVFTSKEPLPALVN